MLKKKTKKLKVVCEKIAKDSTEKEVCVGNVFLSFQNIMLLWTNKKYACLVALPASFMIIPDSRGTCVTMMKQLQLGSQWPGKGL